MFSGIVQQTSSTTNIDRQSGLMSLTIDLSSLATNLKRGASVSIAGVCLTTTNVNGSTASFDVMQETLTKTTLGSLNVGDRVNIERSVKIGDEIGGHTVSGHITGTATITNIETPLHNWIMTITCAPEWIPYILPKGFIALDGCSLTIVDTGSDFFTVHLIPETLRITTFGTKKIGDHVNVELDTMTRAVVDTVRRYMSTQ